MGASGVPVRGPSQAAPRQGWEKQGRRPDQYILVWVDDVDAMYQHVKDAGVAVEMPEDKSYDVRTLDVRDPEGYRWSFLRRLGTGYIQTTPVEKGGLREVRGS